MVAVFPHAPPSALMDDPDKEERQRRHERAFSQREHHDDSRAEICAREERTEDPQRLPPQAGENDNLNDSERSHEGQKVETAEQIDGARISGEFGKCAEHEHERDEHKREDMDEPEVSARRWVVVCHKKSIAQHPHRLSMRVLGDVSGKRLMQRA